MRALAWDIHERRFQKRPPRILKSEILEVLWAKGVCRLVLEGQPVAIWRSRTAQVTAFVPPAHRASWLRLLRWMLARSDNEVRGGGTLHASSIALGGQAFVCCGPSGVGKSTLYGLAEARARICDEFCDIVRRGGRYAVLAGSGLEARSRCAVPVGGLLFPRPAKAARLVPVPPAQASARILANSHFGLWHDRHPAAALAFATGFCSKVRAFELHFPLERGVVGWLEGSLAA